MPELTLERARELFNYNQDTGIFTRRKSLGPRAKATSVGGYTDKGYVIIGVDGRSYKAHRLAWFFVHGSWPNHEIDHINGIKDDNRIANLRDATTATNQHNVRAAHLNNSSGFLGVCLDRRCKKFMAQIKASGKNIYLGRYTTPEEAHQAYVTAKRKLHEGNTL
jgi:hypothetical protein